MADESTDGTKTPAGTGAGEAKASAPAPPATAQRPVPKPHEPPGNPVMVAPRGDRDAVGAPGARPATAPPGSGVTRRGLFSWAAAGWVGFTAAVGGCMTAFGRFMIPNVLYEPPTQFKVGKPEDFQKGAVDERFKESNGVWIVWEDDNHLVAIIAVCTHLGCPPNWLGPLNKFKCPCHGSGYYKSGVNFEGPTPRPLERAAIWIDPDDGQVVVDKSRKFRWELGQWDDPASFIKMG